MRLTKDQLRLRRWLRALGIAKTMFEVDGYHTVYLKEIETSITEAENARTIGLRPRHPGNDPG